mmetsp:Transcript_83438/g.269905  ORF Transcript_83438/g.269905 Transcript_83438/m.269905 type:complete len:282 (+) Transcript_83438:67-912(+)
MPALVISWLMFVCWMENSGRPRILSMTSSTVPRPRISDKAFNIKSLSTPLFVNCLFFFARVYRESVRTRWRAQHCCAVLSICAATCAQPDPAEAKMTLSSSSLHVKAFHVLPFLQPCLPRRDSAACLLKPPRRGEEGGPMSVPPSAALVPRSPAQQASTSASEWRALLLETSPSCSARSLYEQGPSTKQLHSARLPRRHLHHTSREHLWPGTASLSRVVHAQTLRSLRSVGARHPTAALASALCRRRCRHNFARPYEMQALPRSAARASGGDECRAAAGHR